MWWMLAPEVLQMRGTVSREHSWKVVPNLYFYGSDPEEIEEEEQATGEKAVTKRNFRVNGLLQVLSSLQLNLKSQTGLKGMQVPSSAPSAVPYPKLEHLATTENRVATSASQATECVGTTTEWS